MGLTASPKKKSVVINSRAVPDYELAEAYRADDIDDNKDPLIQTVNKRKIDLCNFTEEREIVCHA